jgi:outer membrane protein OmpA-like peptidoglycan-associated protein
MKLFLFITSLLLCLQVNAQQLNPNAPIPVLVKYEIGGIKLTKDPSNKLVLDSLVTFLKQHPELKVEIDNHTDRAYLKYNTNISQARAQCIADTLIKLGIAPQRLTPKGWRNTKPLIPQQQIDAMKTQAEKDAAMAKNRRTEIVIIGK